MTLEQFQRITHLIGNTTWVRTYITSFPGQLVLEIANLDGSDLSRLRTELSDAGFREVPVGRHGVPERILFAVTRND